MQISTGPKILIASFLALGVQAQRAPTEAVPLLGSGNCGPTLTTREIALNAALDGFIENAVTVSPDRSRLAYVLARSNGQSIVVNDMEGPRYDEILKNSLHFSRRGRRTAYVGKRDGKWRAVVDGVEGQPHEIINEILFSPDGARFAYIARDAGKSRVVLDGSELEAGDYIHGLVFLPDGKELAYVARHGRKYLLLMTDGARSTEYDAIGRIVFSPDGKRIAYDAERDGKHFLVIDGVAGKAFDNVRNVAFSPDSRRIAYTAAIMEGRTATFPGRLTELAVVDGAEGKQYDRIDWMRFSPDSQRVAFIAKRDGKELPIVDNIPLRDDLNAAWAIVFSPDSRAISYVGNRGKEVVVVKNGIMIQTVRLPETIGLLIYSPSGNQVAYVVKSGDTERIAIDGVQGKPYHRVWKSEVPYAEIAGYGRINLGLFSTREDSGLAFEGPTAVYIVAKATSKFFRVANSFQSENRGCAFVAPVPAQKQ